jgi:hypothetical protein
MALLAGCHEPQQNPQPAGQATTTKEPSDMRTVIPLVRHLDPGDTGPIELEFDVPAQADDDAPPLFIGMRVAGGDGTAVGKVVDQLIAADISTEIHLYRIEQSGQVAVELRRSQRIGRGQVGQVVVTPDGRVPGLSPADADFTSMQAAGLVLPGQVYRELEFAGASSVPSGRYRAVIRLHQDRHAVFDANAELIIAYTRKAK